MSALSKKQIDFLRRCAEFPVDSWGVGAATVSSLRKLGLIEKTRANGFIVNAITDAGRAALAEIPAPIDLMAKLRESVQS